ncbi:MAG TPA: hypothetical protein VFZ77_14630 [Acidimicrobiales bacterium]
MDRPAPPPDERAGAVPGPGAGPTLGAGRALDDGLARLTAEARVDEAVRARARERWLRRQAEEERSLAGVLADLVESGATAEVRTVAPGAVFAGVVRSVGADVLSLATGERSGEVLVSLEAVASVRTRAGAAEVLGDRRRRGAARLADVLVTLAGEREEVRVVTRDGGAVTGTVRSVGEDVLVVASCDARPAIGYVALGAIAAVVVGGG